MYRKKLITIVEKTHIVSARIITIFNQKGGIGKSIITAQLATFLSVEQKLKILVIDSDSNRTIYSLRKLSFNKKVQPHFQLETVNKGQLPEYLVSLYKNGDSERFDLIFLDLPSFINDEIFNLIRFSNCILIPVVLEPADIFTTKRILNMMLKIQIERESKGFEYLVYAFINKKMKVKQNILERELRESGIAFFDNALFYRKVYSRVDTFTSLLSANTTPADVKFEFSRFCEEFLEKLKIKSKHKQNKPA